MSEFFAMGGYGFYVWSSFALSTIIILVNIIEPILHHKNALKEADDFYSDNN